jgi:hypothetical protein
MKKLTLSADHDVIRDAKKLARKNRTSVSAMFGRMIRMMAEEQSAGRPPRPVGPITRKATGLISMPANKTDRHVLEEALTQKHGLDK